MFTRVVTLTCKPGQAKQVCKKINDNVLPFLKKQRGFLDEIVLVSTTDPNLVVAESFWNSHEDAELYNREQFPKIREMMEELFVSAPVVETYNVETSTSYRITAGKKAA